MTWTLAILGIVAVVMLRWMVVQPFRAPSGSMQPTVQVGSYFVVTKWSYGWSRDSFGEIAAFLPHGRIFFHEPKRGDVVVFRTPPEPDRSFLKRLVGMPGDRVQMVNGALVINGTPVPRVAEGTTLLCPSPGAENEPVPLYRETLPGGVSYLTCDRTPDGPLDNTEVFVVPPGNYFMMGDDRDNSADSRTAEVGYVPAENLIGPAVMPPSRSAH